MKNSKHTFIAASPTRFFGIDTEHTYAELCPTLDEFKEFCAKKYYSKAHSLKKALCKYVEEEALNQTTAALANGDYYDNVLLLSTPVVIFEYDERGLCLSGKRIQVEGYPLTAMDLFEQPASEGDKPKLLATCKLFRHK